VSAHSRKQKVPRTGRCANLLLSMSRKHKKHATRHCVGIVAQTVHRSPSTYQQNRRSIKRMHARRRQSKYPNRGVEQQSTKEARRQDKTGGPTEILVQTHGPAEQKCRRMIEGAGVGLPVVGGATWRISTFPKFLMTGVSDGPTEIFVRGHGPAERKCGKK
jgi:hypothetical protein